MRRIDVLALALAVSSGTMGCAGPSLSSVKATAALGQKLGDYGDALDGAQTYCARIQRLTGDARDTCAALDPKWRRAPRVLSAYAGALARLAGHDDVEVNDQLTAVLGASAAGNLSGGMELSKTEQGIVALVADALVSSAGAAWREGKLKEAITDYNGYVGGAVKDLTTMVDLQLDKLRLLESAVDGFAKSTSANLTDGDDAGAAIRRNQRILTLAWLDDLTLWVREQRSRLIHYKRALAGFGDAHQALFEHAQDFAENDPEILQAILAKVAALAKLIPDGG